MLKQVNKNRPSPLMRTVESETSCSSPRMTLPQVGESFSPLFLLCLATALWMDVLGPFL